MPAKVEYTNDGSKVAQGILKYLNSWPDKPCNFGYEELDADPSTMMVQELQRAQIDRKYINGSYMGSWAFAVYCKVSGKDTKERMAVTSMLMALDDWMNQHDDNGAKTNLPELDTTRTATSIEMTGNPDVVSRSDNGELTFQAVFILRYTRRI